MKLEITRHYRKDIDLKLFMIHLLKGGTERITTWSLMLTRNYKRFFLVALSKDLGVDGKGKKSWWYGTETNGEPKFLWAANDKKQGEKLHRSLFIGKWAFKITVGKKSENKEV